MRSRVPSAAYNEGRVAIGFPPRGAGEAAMAARFESSIRAPEFPEGMDWLNVSRPLTLAELRGKLVILDFWTFC